MNGIEGCITGGAITFAVGLVFFGLSKLRSNKVALPNNVQNSMSPDEVAHQHAMEAKHGTDPSGRNWLTMTRSMEVFGSDHPAGKKS